MAKMTLKRTAYSCQKKIRDNESVALSCMRLRARANSDAIFQTRERECVWDRTSVILRRRDKVRGIALIRDDWNSGNRKNCCKNISLTDTLSLTHKHTLSLTHTNTHSLSHTQTHTLSLSQSYSFSLSHTFTHTYTLTLSHTQTHTLSLSQSCLFSLTHLHSHIHTHSLSHSLCLNLSHSLSL